MPNITQVDYVTQLKNKPGPGFGYVTSAPSSPLFIPASTHLQGSNVTVDAWSGAPVNGHITGDKVYCDFLLASSGNGDITVTWSGADVGCVAVSSVAGPYAVAANSSPMVILESVHRQGMKIAVDCWSGPLVNGAITGHKVMAVVMLDSGGTGNVTVIWSGSDVKSILISGQTPQAPYVGNAVTSPITIPSPVHLQGPNVSVECWSGPLVGGNITGTKVYANPFISFAGNGNVTISWGGNDIRSFIISASGPSVSSGPPGPTGPPGPPGPPGPASSYILAATSSPQSVPQSLHLQGIDAQVICYDGPVSGGTCTGSVVNAGVFKDASGNFTIFFAGSDVGSIQIKK